MRSAIALALLTAGCAGTAAPIGPTVAIYVPPVRPGGAGGMMFLPGQPRPGDMLPAAAAFRAGGARLRDGAQPLADEAACRAQVDLLTQAAVRRHPAGGGVDIVAEPGRLTLIGRFGLPSPTLVFACDGTLLMRERGVLTPHARPVPVAMPPIRTAPVER